MSMFDLGDHDFLDRYGYITCYICYYSIFVVFFNYFIYWQSLSFH